MEIKLKAAPARVGGRKAEGSLIWSRELLFRGLGFVGARRDSPGAGGERVKRWWRGESRAGARRQRKLETD